MIDPLTMARLRIRTLLLFFLLFSVVGSIKAQQDTSLNATLKKMTQATITSDTHEILRYSSPRTIKAMGGIERASEQFKRGFETLRAQGISVDTVINFNEFSVLNKNNIHYNLCSLWFYFPKC